MLGECCYAPARPLGSAPRWWLLEVAQGAWWASVLTPPEKPFFPPLGEAQNHRSPGTGRCAMALQGHGVPIEGS